MQMRLNEGSLRLKNEIKKDPTNVLPYVLLNYDDFVSLTFNENPSQFKLKHDLLEKRLKVVETGDKNSPYYLFSKGLLYFQWSMIEAKHTEFWNAAWNFRRSFLLFKENKKKFPNFAPNDIYLGLQYSLISTIPSGYKWLSNILGLKGNMKAGMNLLKAYTERKDQAFKEESFLYYIYLKNYLENDPEAAMRLIKSHKLDTKNNMLYVFMAANLSLNNKNAAMCQQYIEQRNRSDDYAPFPMLDYELGDAKMKKLDKDANKYYEKYLKEYKGSFYIKDANQNLSFFYYLNGNMKLAEQYKKAIATNGTAETDADKQALRFSKQAQYPEKDLLKARLLNDGGYNEKALQILSQKDTTQWRDKATQLEFYYRLGRIFDELGQSKNALFHYSKTIQLGSNSKEYYPARAALQAAAIHEKDNNKSEALRLYKLVLSMDFSEYKNSLDQRAKAGINRIQGG